jgi:hypothetical protein
MQIADGSNYLRFQCIESGIGFYWFNPDAFNKDECHMLFPIEDNRVYLIAKRLEFNTFHPDTPLNKKFNVNFIQCCGINFYWFSFPIEFRKQCEKVASVYKMTMENEGRFMFVQSKKAAFVWPDVPHLLKFQPQGVQTVMDNQSFEREDQAIDREFPLKSQSQKTNP